MSVERYVDILPEVQEAVAENRPVVALESTILSHGMPYPENLAFARQADAIIREEGAVPATMAIVGGRVKAGLTMDELELLCRAENVGKVSRRDLATYLATGMPGATTVTTGVLGYITVPSRSA